MLIRSNMDNFVTDVKEGRDFLFPIKVLKHNMDAQKHHSKFSLSSKIPFMGKKKRYPDVKRYICINVKSK